MNSLLKATAVAMVVSVLAATAEAAAGSYIATIASGDFLSSPIFLWVTANAIVIIIWLLSSRRGMTNDDTAAASSAGHDGEVVHDAVDSIYTSSSEYEAFSDAGSARPAEAAASKRLAREAARAARRADRPRVRKKPAAGQDAPSPRAVVAAAAAARELDDEIRRAETPVVATEARLGDGVDDDEDVSMDSLWQSIVQRRAARPVVVQKSDSWGNDELPRLQRVAETAATGREMRKSVSAVNKPSAAPPPPQPAAPSSVVRQLQGWRTRDVLVTISPDELLQRAESFIRRQHEHLRLQRQESEQRQLQLQRRLHAPTLIRAGV